ncbi:hypothetical protein N7533_003650 [Penicillium manginii]|uniref:uncharacterized protein n=1 Tax=Penicillium manginii TaxID=203109 RepID=UPI0025477D16|nr:uncharacterized protein N7533_003650 [Penicillium manginii]KAJ5761611.1 hypothetical protein N7533_003650 [Penicillium manginii]
MRLKSKQGHPVDLRLWYNYFTFDLLGDFAFGESFDCMNSSTCHQWVDFVLDHFNMSTLLHVIHRFRPLQHVLAAMVRQRIEGATDRPDFISPMLEANRNGLLSLDEVEQQASILILAGSETTSLALTFTTALLLQHPVILNRLTEEIRALFTSDTDITTSTINDLSYLQATPEEGAMVAGHFIPKDTVVNVSQWSAYRSETNFIRANEFIPERWLGDSEFTKDAKGAFQPFSVGPRACICKKFAYDSMKLLVAHVLWNFNLTLEPASACSLSEWLDCPSYVSFHPAPLLVNMAARVTV